MDKFWYTLERHGGKGLVMHLHGSLDVYSSPELRLALEPELNGGSRLIVVDLSGVEFIDSSGIATLAGGLAWSRQSGGRFVLAGIRSRVKDVFAMAKLDDAFETAADCESALATTGPD